MGNTSNLKVKKSVFIFLKHLYDLIIISQTLDLVHKIGTTILPTVTHVTATV